MIGILFPIPITQRKLCQESIINFSNFQNVILQKRNILVPRELATDETYIEFKSDRINDA